MAGITTSPQLRESPETANFQTGVGRILRRKAHRKRQQQKQFHGRNAVRHHGNLRGGGGNPIGSRVHPTLAL
jgi:hypothetical protein